MGGMTHQVRVWQIKHVQGRRRSYGVRWITAGPEHSEWYATKSLAEAFWAQLVRAQKAGEGFEVSSGLPLTLMRQRGERTLLELAVAYVDWLWKRSPANTRKAGVTSLAAIVPLFCRSLDHPPELASLQRLLSTRLLPPPRRAEHLIEEERAAASWLSRASRSIGDLADELTADELLLAIGKTVDAGP